MAGAGRRADGGDPAAAHRDHHVGPRPAAAVEHRRRAQRDAAALGVRRRRTGDGDDGEDGGEARARRIMAGSCAARFYARPPGRGVARRVRRRDGYGMPRTCVSAGPLAGADSAPCLAPPSRAAYESAVAGRPGAASPRPGGRYETSRPRGCCAAVIVLPTSARQAAVPELPFESVPESADDARRHPLRRDRRRRRQLEGARVRVLARQLDRAVLHGARRRSCSSSTPTASSSARSARTSTPGRTRTPCASTRTTTSGSSTRART